MIKLVMHRSKAHLTLKSNELFRVADYPLYGIDHTQHELKVTWPARTMPTCLDIGVNLAIYKFYQSTS